MNKFYAFAAAAALPLIAAARPATPEILRHTDPDGKVIEYRLFGNEEFNYMTDISGRNVLELKSGRLVPAVRNGKALVNAEADLQLLSEETPRLTESTARGGMHRMAALDNNGRTVFPTIGEVRSCVILVEYADTPFSSADANQQFTRLCNEKGYSDFGSRGSAKDYFLDVSKGKFSPTFDVYGPIKLQHNAQWYVGMGDTDDPDDPDNAPTLAGYQHNARFGYAIKEALEALDDKVDFSIYDYDNDGRIDNIFFFYSGYGQADTGNKKTIWPHQADFLRYTDRYNDTPGLDPITIDGKKMATYACSCELNGSSSIPVEKRPYIDGIGAFCHEFGHVLGLPDLYNVGDVRTKTPGKYSIMDQGSYNMNSTCPPAFSAYEMYLCRWLELDLLEDGESVTLYPLSSDKANAKRIRFKNKDGITNCPEYFVFECRDNSGWDESLGQNGMLAWRINYLKSAWSSNRVNVDNNPRIEIISPDEDDEIIGWPGEDNQFTYYVPTMRRFISSALGGKNIEFTLSNISYDYEEPEGCPVTFEYNKYQQTADKTVLDDTPFIATDVNAIRLKWQKVPGVTNYALTVKRNSFFIEGLDEKLVGDVDHYDIDLTNITAAQRKNTFSAYVRCYNGIPSSVTSNKILFIPDNLDAHSGVGEIGAEIPVIVGGKGCVIAPEGARVFNLSGVETSTDNLPAGVYIVVADGVTAKVAVY